MSNTFRKIATATALAAGLSGISTTAYAVAGVSIDSNGGAPGGDLIKADKWTWTKTSVLFKDVVSAEFTPGGGLPADDRFSDTRTDTVIYAQGQIASMSLGGGVEQGINSFAFELAIPVTADRTFFTDADSFGAVVSFDPATFGADNYFRLYSLSDPTTLDQEAGTGFVDKLILDAKIDLLAGNTLAIDITQPADASGVTDLEDDAVGSVSQPAVQTRNLTGALNLAVNVCTATEAAAAGVGDMCAGGTSFILDETTLDNYFPNTEFLDNLALDFDFIGATKTPFSFFTVPDMIAGHTANFGETAGGSGGLDDATAVNDLLCGSTRAGATTVVENDPGVDNTTDGGCDIMAEVRSATSIWNANIVPTPDTLALLGLSLLGIGSASARRRRSR